jgi:hypothetical protein
MEQLQQLGIRKRFAAAIQIYLPESKKFNDLIKQLNDKNTEISEINLAGLNFDNSAINAELANVLKMVIDFNNKRGELLDKEQQEENEKTKQALKDLGDYEKERQEVRDKYGLITDEEKLADELKALNKAYEQGLLTEEEYIKAVKKLKEEGKKGVEGIFGVWGDEQWEKDADYIIDKIQSKLSDFSNAVADLETIATNRIEREYNQRYAALDAQLKNGVISQKKYDKEKQKLDDEKRKAEIEAQKKYAGINLTIQISSIISQTALAAMQAYSALAGIPVVGPALAAVAMAAAVAEGAIQIAKAKSEYDKVMSLSYAKGGFTPKGKKYQQVGAVHAGEYVIPQEGVNNPNILPVIDYLEQARQSGNLANMRKDDLRAALGGSMSKNTPQTTNKNAQNQEFNKEIQAIVTANIIVMEKLQKRLDEGIEAYSVISGKNGSYQKTKEYQSIVNNAKRK